MSGEIEYGDHTIDYPALIHPDPFGMNPQTMFLAAECKRMREALQRVLAAVEKREQSLSEALPLSLRVAAVRGGNVNISTGEIRAALAPYAPTRPRAGARAESDYPKEQQR